jgi:hypothetical protein
MEFRLIIHETHELELWLLPYNSYNFQEKKTLFIAAAIWYHAELLPFYPETKAFPIQNAPSILFQPRHATMKLSKITPRQVDSYHDVQTQPVVDSVPNLLSLSVANASSLDFAQPHAAQESRKTLLHGL